MIFNNIRQCYKEKTAKRTMYGTELYKANLVTENRKVR